MTESLREQLAGTPLSGANAPYVEGLYEQYLQNPASVETAWRSYFDALPALPAAERAHSRSSPGSRRARSSVPPRRRRARAGSRA